MKKTVAALALLLAACGTTAACGSGSGDSPPATTTTAEDLHDPDTLARNVAREVLEQRGTTLDVTCIGTSDRDTFICHAYAPEDGSEGTVTVHVSTDGQTFITDGSGDRA